MRMRIKYGIVLALICLVSTLYAEPPEQARRGHTAFVALHSEVVDSASYEMDRHELTLNFQNGSMYVYAGVPEDIFSGLVNAEAPGRFFLKFIRGRFVAERVTETRAAALVQARQ